MNPIENVPDGTEAREKRLQQELSLSRQLAIIGEVASGIAHEINNPLTGVLGLSELLLSRDLPNDVKKDIQSIRDEARRIARIVEGLLIFARKRKPGQEYLDLNDIIKRILELRSYEMKIHNIQVVTQLAPDIPRTMADPGQIQQVFLNVILNAEKEMVMAHNKGKLLIRTEKVGNIIKISFADDGRGIPPEIMDKIFQPFFTTREVGSGVGLGLSICHGIVTAHQGKIYAESEYGKGATFIVELPVTVDAEQVDGG